MSGFHSFTPTILSLTFADSVEFLRRCHLTAVELDTTLCSSTIGQKMKGLLSRSGGSELAVWYEALFAHIRRWARLEAKALPQLPDRFRFSLLYVASIDEI
jgi:hypothetical protein